MKAYIKSRPTRKPGVFIAANNALTSHKNNADILCDGTGDEQQIQDAVDEISSTGGRITLSEGNFSLSDEIIIENNNISIEGMGYSTKITQTATGKPIINSNAYYTTIEDLWIVMPTSDGADGIITGTTPRLRNLRLQGGDTDHYLIKMVNAMNMHVENITTHGAIGNGIQFSHNTAIFDGNGHVNNVQMSMGNNATGIYIDEQYNLIKFDGINIVTGRPAGNNIIAIHLNGAARCTFDQLDLELIDYSIILDTGVERGHGARGNVFTNLFTNAHEKDISLDINSYNNIFVGVQTGVNTWEILDEAPRDLSRRNRFIGTTKYIMESEPPIFYDDFMGAALNPVWKTTGSVNIATSLGTITTGATTGNMSRIDFNGNGGYKDLYETYMEFKANRVSSGDYDVYMGMSNTDFQATNHAAYFRALNTDENWQLCVSGAACTPTYTPPYTVDSEVAIDTTPHTFKIHRNNTSMGVQFYIDDVWVGDLRHCMPVNTISREPIFQITTQEDAAKSLAVDYVILQQGRALTP